MTNKIKEVNPIGKDIGIILLSIFVAVFIVESGIMHKILTSWESHIVGSIIAGIFFTSVFTTAPAIVVLGEIAATNSVFTVAFFGAAGALLGDWFIFRFVRDRLTENLMEFIKKGHPHLKALFYSRAYKRFLQFLGALVIASPLPDELGLVMLGASHVDKKSFVLISFTLNFLGILAIGLVSRALI